MTAIEDRPTISERYTSATESSNLKVNGPGQRDDADIIIAAGWLTDRLGAKLLRLRREFETASGDLERARQYAAALFDAASEQRKRGKKEPDPERRDKLLFAAKQGEDEARRTMMTERALAMIRLKSLRETREAVGRFAVQQATKQRFMRPDSVVLVLVGRVLDVYLDPGCHHCGGRGFNGGATRNDKPVICRECGGTGHRKDSIGHSMREHEFSRHLLTEMDRMVAMAAGGMKASLRSHPEMA